MHRYRIHVILAISCIFQVLTACGPTDPTTPPNVIIITLDTVRADHLGCYGYPVDTTPHLDALASVATRYERCVASSSWTLPTHASFFTGKFAFEHGAHGFLSSPAAKNNINRLPESELTLAEALREEGYATTAYVANDALLGTRWQVDQGFEIYHVDRERCTIINDKVFAWLQARPDKPFMLFINYMDAHRPYNAETVPGLLPRPVVHDRGDLVRTMYEEVMPGTEPVSPELQQRVIDQYDTALRNLDTGLGALFDELKRLGVYENTVLVVTSDHGEFFGEHRLVEHSKDVYEEVMSIPLIIKYPGQTEGGIESTTATASDLPGLILAAFPNDVRKRRMVDFPDMPGTHEVVGELYYTRTKDLYHPIWGKRFRRVRTAIYDGPFKYIDSSDGAHELYDLDADPGEAVNLIETEAGTAARLAGRLGAFLASRAHSDAEDDKTPLTRDEIRRLRSLGYVGD